MARQDRSSANLLVIGPRGCGKTTVFRSLSFNCLADANQINDALERPYLGLYISCNKDFRQRFSAIESEVLQKQEDSVRHYFNLLVLREFVGALIACNKVGGVGENDLKNFCRFVEQVGLLDFTKSRTAKETLSYIEATIIRTIQKVRMNIWHNRPIENHTGQDFIAELAQLAIEGITPFHGKVLYLFIDDYTERKVPREAQRALNHILFIPNGIYKAKMSSEVFGVPPDQTFGAFLDQDRDYKEWNLGTMYYLKLPERQQKDFLSDIVDKRLRLCGYTGKVMDVIGPSKYGEGNLARSLKKEAEARAEARQQKKEKLPEQLATEDAEAALKQEGKKTYYHGWDTICDLCTGDVSNILELLHRIYEECGIRPDSTAQIEDRRQNAVIEAYSQQYISKIKGIPKYGEKLFKLVNAFGNMSASFLREYPWINRGPNRLDPYQVIRIEMDEAYTDFAQGLLEIDHLSNRAIMKYNESTILWMLLQRYCIFIDAHERRSRRNTLASKVILRRIFCPAFRISLTNSECYTIRQQVWQAFCTDPEGTTKRYVNNAIEEAKIKRGDERQMKLPYELKESNQ